MIKFHPIKTIKKFIIPILILTILGSSLVYLFCNKKQSYTSSILIEYTGSKAEKGLNPDDTVIDITELYSATIIDNVIKTLNLDCSVEEIRSSITVLPVIPVTETKRETAAIEINDEYSFIPTKYLITYTADSEHSEEYSREVLDSVLTQYSIFYSEKYVENVAYPNNAVNISLEYYDYIECVELLRSNINSIATYCMARDASFYSAKSGYSFPDLQLELEYLRDNPLYDLNTYILVNKLTMDRNLLLQKEANNVAQYEIKIKNTNEYIEEQRAVIAQFAEKTLDGQAGMGNLEESGIITDVEEDFRRGSFDTTYDILINNYAKLLLDVNYYESELANAKKVIETFTERTEQGQKKNEISNDAEIIAKEKLEVILNSFNEMYNNFVKTVKDYYNVRSADYLSFNSNIVTVSNVNVKLYLVLAAFMFAVMSSCFFIVFERIKEIISTSTLELEKFTEENESAEEAGVINDANK